MKLKVIHGAPCSGKSTYVRNNIGANDVVFDYDRIITAITYDEVHSTDKKEYAHNFALNMRAAFIDTVKRSDDRENTAWFIITRLNEKIRKWLSECDPEYIEMTATIEECLERLESDDSRPDKEKWEREIRKYFDEIKEGKRMKRTFKNTAQQRALPVFTAVKDGKRIESDYYVEGYAARFDPYVLISDDDGDVYEQFDRDCFAGADMSDIIMQFDHTGHVMARTGNGTLIVEVDDNGLFIAADLSRTERARQLYDEIKSGMVTKMSWRFSLGEYEYDPQTMTIRHHTVKKIYDVSAVSIPANDDTEINARSWADGEISLRARRDAELEDRKKRLRTKIMIGGIINE